MNKTSVEVEITSGRTLSQGRGIEKGKTTNEYLDAVAVCEIDSDTMKTLGIESGDIISIETEYGRTTVRSKLDKNLRNGLAFMPCGPHFNALLSSDTQNSGMPAYKTVKASIRPAKDEEIPSIEQMAITMKKVK